MLGDAADAGMDSAVMGMAHRGRLNVLVNIVGKSYDQLFREFESNVDEESTQGSGDVKYHLGQRGTFVSRKGNEIPLELAANPSHLEAVDPVVVGMVRARMDDIDRSEGYGSYPVLPLAAKGGHLDVVRFLVENGADVNARNRYHSTPLYLAAIRKHPEVAEYLLQQGADPNLSGYGLRTPLHMALKKKQHDLAIGLIENGAEINAQSYWGWSALHYALHYKDTEMAKTLILSISGWTLRMAYHFGALCLIYILLYLW